MNRDSRRVRRLAATLPCLGIVLLAMLITACICKSKPVTQCNSSIPQSAGEVWKSALERELVGTDRMDIYGIRSLENSVSKLLEITDKRVIAKFLQAIEIDSSQIAPGMSFHCMCIGELRFEFGRRGQKLAELTIHHGQSLRWDKGQWEGDAQLTPESQTRMADWVAEHAKFDTKPPTTVKLP